jgi:hypothetical protein
VWGAGSGVSPIVARRAGVIHSQLTDRAGGFPIGPAEECAARALRLAYEYCGHIHHFCSRSCREQFEAPLRYYLRAIAVA